MNSEDTSDNRPLYTDTNLKIIFSITLMAVLGVSSITPAFPKISRELNITPQSVGMLIIFFTLPGIILTPIFGVVADRLGRKKVMIPSMLLFGIAGTACFFVKHFETLLVLRFLQGVGAASIGSLNITLIGDIYSGKDRPKAMGYNASLLSIATASYPILGGLLATIAWYFPFILPVFAIPIAFVILFRLDNPEPRSSQNLKSYLRSIAENIKTRSAIIYFTTSLVTFIILYGCYLTYFPFLLNHNFHASPFIIGLTMSSMSIVTAITSSQLGKLSQKFSEIRLLQTSFILYTVSLIMVPLMQSIWLLLIPAAIFGVAQGLNIPSVQILLTRIAPLEHRGAFMSFNGMVLRLGQTLGPVLMGTVIVYFELTGVFIAGAVIAAINFLLLLRSA